MCKGQRSFSDLGNDWKAFCTVVFKDSGLLLSCWVCGIVHSKGIVVLGVSFLWGALGLNGVVWPAVCNEQKPSPV